MNIVDLIKKIFAPLPQDDQRSVTLRKHVEASDAFALQDELLNSLGARLKALYGGRRDLVEDCTLLLWIADDNVRKVLNDSHDRVLNYVRDDVGMPIADVRLMGGHAPDGATPFCGNFAFTLSDKNRASDLVNLAKIRIHEGRGTLIMGEYMLAANDERYEIGRGLTGRHAIGIAADGSDPNYELNKYVRSHHAFIEYHQKYGFCLVVQRDGSRIHGGSRTQIKHPDGSTTELDTPGLPVPLIGGDVIILGKSVELEYVTLKQ